MDNSTPQPQPISENPQEQSVKSPYGKRNWKKWVVIYVVIGVLIYAGIYYLVLGKQGTKPYSANYNYTQPTTPAQPTTPQTVDTSNWKTYSNEDYSFRYPADWKLTTSEYLNSVTLTSENSAVSLTFSEGQYPYGFAGDVKSQVANKISVMVGDVTYETNENVINNESAFVDFQLADLKKHHVLFGTGYPAGFGGKTSLADYQAAKSTILQILSTFTFTE